MKLNHLECLCEIVACAFNLSRAAVRIHLTQPAVTRQIQLLERELGFAVFSRRGTKFLGLTPAGSAVFERAKRIISETRELRRMNDDFRQDTRGKLSVATTQYHARYTLLPVIKRFRQQRPHVSLSILSVDPYSAAQLVLEGIADFGLSAESLENSKDLLIFPCLKVRRIVIVPRGHPLVHARQLSLERIARYPLIVYDHRLSGGREVLDTFERNGIAPNIALSAMDSEVLKAYVTEGLGISIIQEHAYDPAADKRIVAVDPGTLFEPTTAYLTVKRGGFLRSYTREFINLLAPHLSMDDIESPVPFPERRIRSA